MVAGSQAPGTAEAHSGRGTMAKSYLWLDAWAQSAKWTAITSLDLTSYGQTRLENKSYQQDINQGYQHY